MKSFDRYYRNFSCTADPPRSPFNRSKDRDSGLQFIYFTNKQLRWTLLLDPHKGDPITEAGALVPMGYSQLWLFEKVYSTSLSKHLKRIPIETSLLEPYVDYPKSLDRLQWPGKLYVCLEEPGNTKSLKRSTLGYFTDRENAIATAIAYTQMHGKRVVVGLMLADVQWH